jgi:hypothetical protein
LCLLDCGADSHAHYYATHGGDIFNKPLFAKSAKERRLALLGAAVAALAAEGAVLQRALVGELARYDLKDLGIDPQEVLRLAGVPEAVAHGAAGAGRAAGGAEGAALPLSWSLFTALDAAVSMEESALSLSQRVQEALTGAALGHEHIAAMRPQEAVQAVAVLAHAATAEEAAEAAAALALACALGEAHCSALAGAGLVHWLTEQGSSVKHLASPQLALSACCALGLLSSNAAARDYVLAGSSEGSASGIGLLVAAAGMHCRAPSPQEPQFSAKSTCAAAWAVRALTGHSAEADAALLAAGVAQRLFFLLDVRRGDAAVAQLGCEALARLCSGPAACDAVLAALAPRAAVAVLGRARDSASSNTAAAAAAVLLQAVAQSCSKERAVLEGGTVPALLQAARAAGEADTVAAALRALAVVAGRCISNRDAVRCAGGEGLLLQAEVAGQEEVQEAAALLQAALN